MRNLKINPIVLQKIFIKKLARKFFKNSIENMKKIFVSFLASLTLLAPFALQADSIKLVGSDIVGEKIIDELKKNFDSLGISFVADMNGSRDGLLNLKEKTADIAIVARQDGSPFPEDKVVVPYAHQLAVVVVNSQNPIEEITIPQLAQIFASSGEKIDKWQSFGLNNNVSLRNISPMVASPSENITLELFKNKVLKGDVVSTNVESKLLTPAIMKSVSNTVNSIAIVSVPPSLPSVKALGVASANGGQFFKPTPENVQNGDYPLALHFYIVYDKANLQKIKPVIQMLLSDAIAEQLEKGLLMPAPKNFRKSYSLGLDIAK